LKRADLYRVRKPSGDDPKRSRVFVVVSRQVTIDSKFSTVICAPVKQDSSIHCDELVSISKSLLTDFVGRLGPEKQRELNAALAIAVGLK
jgi:mRNA interferase MazF